MLTGGQLPLQRCDPGVGGLHLLVPVQRGRHVPLPPHLKVIPEWHRVDSQLILGVVCNLKVPQMKQFVEQITHYVTWETS